MSRPLIVNIPHTLGRDEATRRLKRGLARASSSIPLLRIERESWSGDHLTFELSGMAQQAYGTAEVTDREVRVEVMLPWLLQTFAELIQGAVKSRAQILLEKK